MAGLQTSTPPVETTRLQRSLSGRLLLVRKALLPLLLLIELVAFTVASHTFLTTANFLNIAANGTEVGLIAAGLTLVILLGGIDVSTGFALGAIAWVVAFLTGANTNPLLIVLCGVGLGVLVGALNGTLIARLAVPSIVATLGTSAILQAVLFALWDRSDIFSGPVLSLLSKEGNILGLPSLMLLVLAVYAVLHATTRYTVFGRSIYAIGSNREAATLAGVRSDAVRITCFMIVGGLVGLAASTYVGRVGVVQASTGSELTLLAIAAVVVGGTSILGGEGSALRTLGGVAFIAVLQNGVVLAGVPPLWNGLMIGFVILLAVSLDGIVSRLDSNTGRRSL